jgi:hypothetical protein
MDTETIAMSGKSRQSIVEALYRLDELIAMLLVGRIEI